MGWGSQRRFEDGNSRQYGNRPDELILKEAAEGNF